MSDRPSLMPLDTPDYMAPAWAAFMRWAIGHEETIEAFRAETGNNWRPASDALGEQIDKATGADDAFVRDFVVWANGALWGPVEEGGAHG